MCVVYGISAPLESVQWPSPVSFSTSGITSGKVPCRPKNLLKNSSTYISLECNEVDNIATLQHVTLQSLCTSGIGRSRRYHKRGQISFSYNGKSMQIFRGSIASGDLLRIEGHDCIFKRKKANHSLYFLFSSFIEKKRRIVALELFLK